jgi:hypothetical protein
MSFSQRQDKTNTGTFAAPVSPLVLLFSNETAEPLGDTGMGVAGAEARAGEDIREGISLEAERVK